MASSPPDWNVAALSDLLTLETDYASIQREAAGLPALSLAQEAELMSKVLAKRFLTSYSREEVQSAFTENIETVVAQQPDVLDVNQTTPPALLSMPEIVPWDESELSIDATSMPSPPPRKNSLCSSVDSISMDVSTLTEEQMKVLLQPQFIDAEDATSPQPSGTSPRQPSQTTVAPSAVAVVKPVRCDSGFQDIEDLLMAAIMSVQPKSVPLPKGKESYV
eukprot:TRINITY_DN5735_c0_g1_i1.p1 TRINITY_DN5735_c0_g1~~TRINITY_DN5735_c0_g1_i1.p1  ORF type:complete len:220 (+),score=41.28 TRINITY_DN5735_c0_g1_i1:81-740(+)